MRHAQKNTDDKDENSLDTLLDLEAAKLLEAFLAEHEAGRSPDPRRLLAEHPELADRLRAGLVMQRLADSLKREASSTGEGVSGLRVSRFPPPSVVLRARTADMTPLDRDEAELAWSGGRLDRYEVRGEIGRGGMGVVLAARDRDLGRDVALKLLASKYRSNREVVRRFVEEAQIGGQLQHPGIVPIFEIGTSSDGRPFFSMKMIQGQTLARLLRERGLPRDEWPRLLGIFEQVCQTLSYAHSLGVIHRDLKPSNVMVGRFGEVQVMDWGLAKVLHPGVRRQEAGEHGAAEPEEAIHTLRSDADGEASRAGLALGTPSYMAPEQARGERDRVDKRTDVFGLGAILCEILTGAPPFQGASPLEVHRYAAAGELEDARQRLDTCGAEPELVTLARSCLAANPDGRPRNATVVSEALVDYRLGVGERLRQADLARVAAETRETEERARRRLAAALSVSIDRKSTRLNSSHRL